MLADCLRDLTVLGPGGLPALLGALFLAGLAGGATHCAGMCAPFVLAQAAAGAEAQAGGGVLRRLSGAALLPYHAGRMLGYGALGAVAGGAAGLLVQASGLRALLAVLLVAAALLMLAAAAERVLPGPWRARLGWGGVPLPPVLQRRIGALLAAVPSGRQGVLLGLMLSALPCGMLYGALAGAAATGSALGGALAMAAFVSGTVPALVGVALVGRFFGRRHGGAMRMAGGVLFALNGVVLLGMALRVAGAGA